jgi:hypothetical protein
MSYEHFNPVARGLASVVAVGSGAYLIFGVSWPMEWANTIQGGTYSTKLSVVIVCLPAIFLGYLVGTLVDLLGWGAPRTPLPKRVWITAAPPGDEPEDVREAWVGLVLPLAPGVTGSRPLSDTGEVPAWVYVVDGPGALALLAKENPEAAAWWRQHDPGRGQPGGRFVFPAEACELELPYVRDFA